MAEEYPTNTRKRVLAAAGLCIALIFAVIPLATKIAPGQPVAALLAHEAVWWSFAVIVLFWLHVVEQLPFSSIGLRRPTWKTLGFGVLAGLVLAVVFVVHMAVIVPVFHLNAARSVAERQIILDHPLWYRILIVVRAAVVEEILFRGYLIEKVRQLSGSIALAVVVSVAAFTYGHLSSWGLVHLIPVFAAAVVLALLYVWRKDLPCNMLGHFIIDGLGFLFA